MAPDGKRVAYRVAEESKPAVLYVADRQQRSAVLRAAGLVYPFWSPDGKRLAVLARSDSTFELVILDTDTKRVLSRHALPIKDEEEARDGMKYRWSPDQQKILLGVRQRSTVVDVKSGSVTHLSERFIRAEWAPDARHLYYMTLHGDLFLHDLGANSATRLLERRMHLAPTGLPEAGPGDAAVIALSPDGRWLASCRTSARGAPGAPDVESMSLLDIYDTRASFVSMTPRRRARLDGVRVTDVQWAPREARVVAIRAFLKEEAVRLSLFESQPVLGGT
jgi:hypothetical protein